MHTRTENNVMSLPFVLQVVKDLFNIFRRKTAVT